MSDGSVPVRRALISVSDKTGLVEFARFLAECQVALLSTGGTAKALLEAGVAVTEVAEATGYPEMLDGRVKTLHPAIHGGILARRDEPSHLEALRQHGIRPIDLVVINLYPFAATLERGADFATVLENIDIGGPALLRAAAKNHESVAALSEPADYAAVMAEMRAGNGATSLALRRRLAAKAFARTGAYDGAIARWLGSELGEIFPAELVLAGALKERLRYGENPHQAAALYVGGEARPGVAGARQLQGKELSYNNLHDTDAAFELVAEFEEPAVAIIKHANPCGVGRGPSLLDAYRKALRCDPVSAYGGIVALNRTLDGATAEEIGKLFAEVVIAPAVAPEAEAALAAKKNLRLLVTGALPDPDAAGLTLRSLAGGYLVQTRDDGRVWRKDMKVVTRRAPSELELNDLVFAFLVAKHVKSNAIVYAKEGATVGIGAGQMSRVDASRIAAWKAEEAGKAAGETILRTKGAVVASDAFFPFADGLLAAVAAGAAAVIQPGGSLRDAEVIKVADEAGIAMVFTGMRHFRH